MFLPGAFPKGPLPGGGRAASCSFFVPFPRPCPGRTRLPPRPARGACVFPVRPGLCGDFIVRLSRARPLIPACAVSRAPGIPSADAFPIRDLSHFSPNTSALFPCPGPFSLARFPGNLRAGDVFLTSCPSRGLPGGFTAPGAVGSSSADPLQRDFLTRAVAGQTVFAAAPVRRRSCSRRTLFAQVFFPARPQVLSAGLPRSLFPGAAPVRTRVRVPGGRGAYMDSRADPDPFTASDAAAGATRCSRKARSTPSSPRVRVEALAPPSTTQQKVGT